MLLEQISISVSVVVVAVVAAVVVAAVVAIRKSIGCCFCLPSPTTAVNDEKHNSQCFF